MTLSNFKLLAFLLILVCILSILICLGINTSILKLSSITNINKLIHNLILLIFILSIAIIIIIIIIIIFP